MTVPPWLSLPEWHPPGVRRLGRDAEMVDALRNWTRGKPLTPGLPHVHAGDIEGEDGLMQILYSDEHRQSWSVRARQQVTGRDARVSGYSSLTTAVHDCIEMARAYEAEDALFLLVPGMA